MKRLLLAGGGHVHIEVLRRFRGAVPAGWEIVLVSPFERQLYSGMVPGVVAGHYALDDCAIELAPLAAHAQARFMLGSLALADPRRREGEGRVRPGAGERHRDATHAWTEPIHPVFARRA